MPCGLLSARRTRCTWYCLRAIPQYASTSATEAGPQLLSVCQICGRDPTLPATPLGTTATPGRVGLPRVAAPTGRPPTASTPTTRRMAAALWHNAHPYRPPALCLLLPAMPVHPCRRSPRTRPSVHGLLSWATIRIACSQRQQRVGWPAAGTNHARGHSGRRRGDRSGHATRVPTGHDELKEGLCMAA